MSRSIAFKMSFLTTIMFTLVSCGGDQDQDQDQDHKIKYTEKTICEGTRTLAAGDYVVCDANDWRISVLKIEARTLSGAQTVEIITIPAEYLEDYERVLDGRDLRYRGNRFGHYPLLGISPLTTEKFSTDWSFSGAAYVVIENTNAGKIQPESGEVVVEYRVMAEYKQ